MPIPTTTYLLDSAKELYLQNSDPSVSGSDPINGLRERESDLSKITVESLIKSMGESKYIELENRLASTIKGKITSNLLGLTIPETENATVTISDFYTNSELSSSSSDYSEYVLQNQLYYFSVEISGGSIDYNSYNYEWIIQRTPNSDDNSIIITEISNTIYDNSRVIEFSILFSDIGSYLYRIKLTNNIYTTLQFYQTKSADVVSFYNLIEGTHVNGSITGDFGLHVYGTSVTLTAIHDSGFEFVGWSGDISGDLVNINPTYITMNSDKTINAEFTNNGKTLTVISDHGDPSPNTGDNFYDYNDEVICVAPSSPVTESNENVRYLLTGYVGTGSAPAAPPASLTFNITSDSTLTWNWSTQYKVIASAGSGGSVGAYTQWNDEGSQITILAEAVGGEPGYTFDKWTDTITGLEVSMPLTINQPYNLIATFTKNDQTIQSGQSSSNVPVGGVIMYNGPMTGLAAKFQPGSVAIVKITAVSGGGVTGISIYTDPVTGIVYNGFGYLVNGGQASTSYILNIISGSGINGKMKCTFGGSVLQSVTMAGGGVAGSGYTLNSLVLVDISNGLGGLSAPDVGSNPGTGLGNDYSEWALCNGLNGTANLTSKFIVGYDPYVTDYNSVGKTGGEKTHILTTQEIPSHAHSYYAGSGSNPLLFNTGTAYGVMLNSGGGQTTGTTGGLAEVTQAHENRPPYYTLAYIQRVTSLVFLESYSLVSSGSFNADKMLQIMINGEPYYIQLNK